MTPETPEASPILIPENIQSVECVAMRCATVVQGGAAVLVEAHVASV